MATKLHEWVAGLLRVEAATVKLGQVECEFSVPISLRDDGPYVVDLKGDQVWHGPRLHFKTTLTLPVPRSR